MPELYPPPAERRADDLLDASLGQRFGVGLETVLLDLVNGHVTQQAAAIVTGSAAEVGSSRHCDGGLDEHFKRTLTVDGVAHAFWCSTYSVPDAYVGRFLTNIERCEPVEWSTSLPLRA